MYTRPGTARYATAAQLSAEERLVAQAQTQGAPRLPRELAARRLGADAALLEAQLRERAQDAHAGHARGLRLDQAAAVWHVLTSARTVEVITGPAGTGKTRVLAAAARAWGGPVFGTATSQNATNELRKAGVQVAANTTRLLADIDAHPARIADRGRRRLDGLHGPPVRAGRATRRGTAASWCWPGTRNSSPPSRAAAR